jgi:hypothetical protein
MIKHALEQEDYVVDCFGLTSVSGYTDVGQWTGDDGTVTNREIPCCQMRQSAPQSIKAAHTKTARLLLNSIGSMKSMTTNTG